MAVALCQAYDVATNRWVNLEVDTAGVTENDGPLGLPVRLYVSADAGATWAPWDGAGGGGGGGNVTVVSWTAPEPVTVETSPGHFDAVVSGQVVVSSVVDPVVVDSITDPVVLGAGAANIGAVGIQAAQTLATVTTVGTVTTLTNPVGAKAILTTGPDVFENLRVASAANMGGANSASLGGALMVNRPGEWVVFSDPGATTQATVTRAAPGAGKTLVITGVSACVLAVAAQSGLTLQLRDGNSGAGTVLASWKFPIPPAGQGRDLTMTGLNIVIPTTNGPATLEFSAAPAATNFESVVLTGYTLAN